MSSSNAPLARLTDQVEFCSTIGPTGSATVTILVFPDAASLRSKTPALLAALCRIAAEPAKGPGYAESDNWIVVPNPSADSVFFASEFGGSMMGVTC